MIDAALRHALREYPRESCGLVVRAGGADRYVECRNTATENDHFVMDPEDYAAADQLGEIVGLVHSHPDAPPEPSPYDLAAQPATGVRWHIVSVPSGNWHTFGDN
jgi:proteasome lid subunit RPN8/RPN11